MLEERTSVARVPPERRVGPAHLVGMESQVQLDETTDRVDLVLGIAQRFEPASRHARADDVVVVKAHTVGSVGARLGFSDVVQQRRQAQYLVGTRLSDDGDRVGEDVFVSVDRVLFERESGNLR